MSWSRATRQDGVIRRMATVVVTNEPSVHFPERQ